MQAVPRFKDRFNGQELRFAVRIPYIWLLLIILLMPYVGTGMNELALVKNGYQMPVFRPNCEELAKPLWLEYGDFMHTCGNHETHVKFFCDWIWISSGWASPGDVLGWTAEGVQIPLLAFWFGLLCKDYKRFREA